MVNSWAAPCEHQWFHCFGDCRLLSKVKKGDCRMTSKLGLEAYDNNIKIWKGWAMPWISHVHMEGMLFQNLFCSARWLMDMERWDFIPNCRTILLFVERLKWLSFLALTHGDLWRCISAWFTVCLFHRMIINPVFPERTPLLKREATGLLRLGTFGSYGSSEWRYLSRRELSSVQYQSVCAWVEPQIGNTLSWLF